MEGDNSWVIHLKVVVFPAPFKPNRPKHSPFSTQKFKFLIATISSFLEQQPPLVNTFLIFFNLTLYSFLFETPFSFVTPTVSKFDLPISSKTKLSSIFVSNLLSGGFVYE